MALRARKASGGFRETGPWTRERPKPEWMLADKIYDNQRLPEPAHE